MRVSKRGLFRRNVEGEPFPPVIAIIVRFGFRCQESVILQETGIFLSGDRHPFAFTIVVQSDSLGGWYCQCW